MSTDAAVLSNPEVQKTGNHYFDPRRPAQPDEIFGVDTQAVLRLARATTALGALPPAANLGLYALPDAVRLMPLVEDMQSGAVITPEDVRPYRKPIKGLSVELGLVDKLAVTMPPARRALNRKIEREFPERAGEAIDKAREAVASVQEEIDYIASFDNPQEQLVTEVNQLAQTVKTAILEQRDHRVHGSYTNAAKPETPKGLMGFVTKVVRKVRSFFGFGNRKRHEINTAVTAYDAGTGIEKTLKKLLVNPTESEAKLPLLSKLVLDKLPRNLPLNKDRLALVAPELLNFLFSISPNNEDENELLSSVDRNPHELRFVTRYKRRFGRYSIDGLQYASRNLLPALRDVLPTSGARVHSIYAEAQHFLREREVNQTDEKEEVEVERQGFRNYIKKVFKRHRPSR